MSTVITVRVNNADLAYEADVDVKVGDHVEVPPMYWYRADDGALTGVVVALSSDYLGGCRSVLRVVPESELEERRVGRRQREIDAGSWSVDEHEGRWFISRIRESRGGWARKSTAERKAVEANAVREKVINDA